MRCRSEIFDEAVLVRKREGANQLVEVDLLGWAAAPPRASCTTWPTRARSSSARGVGTRPRPALTNSGSPVVSRNRANARLIADELSRKRWAARATLPSVSSASRVTSRLRSGRRHASSVAHSRSRCGVRCTNKVQMVRVPPCRPRATSPAAPAPEQPKNGVFMKAIMARRDRHQAEAGRSRLLPVGHSPACCYRMLLSSLGTSIANVGLPTMAQAFALPSSKSSGSCWPISWPSPP